MSTSPTNHNALVRVDFKARPRLKSIGGGLYERAGEDGYFARPVCKRRQREVRLKARTERLARAELGLLLGKIAQYEAGIGPDPFLADVSAVPLASLAEFYLEQNCPRRSGQARQGEPLTAEKRIVDVLLKWPGMRRTAKQITLEDCREYRDWRVKKVTRGKGGDRTVDIELATLSNIFRTAQRHKSVTGIETNPIGHERPRFRDSNKVTHCREHMPRSGDELHALARYCFECGPLVSARQTKRIPTTEVFGWLILLTAICGHRIGAMMKLRIDALTKNDPGFLDKRRLYLFRSTTHKGTCGHVDLTAEEFDCLQAFLEWHRRRHSTSPWFFPSPIDSTKPLDDSSLTHRLFDVCRALRIGHVTSHGLRAFRVNVLRGRGLSDDKVADQVGQKTRGKLIVEVYGEGLDEALKFMPEKSAPAWEHFQSGPKHEQLHLGI